MKLRRLAAGVTALALGTVMFANCCLADVGEVIYYPDSSIKENLPEEQPSAREDFYLSVNYEELKDTDIPDGMSDYGSFAALNDQVVEKMTELLETAGTSEQTETSTGLEDAAAVDSELEVAAGLYQMYTDMDSRNEDGWEYIKPYVEEVSEAASVEDLLELIISDDTLFWMSNVFNLGIVVDQDDSTKYVFKVTTPDLDLGDSAEYTEKTELGQLYYDADETFYQKLLLKYGYSEEDAAAIIGNRYEWETLMAEHLYPTAVSYQADYQKLIYNPYSFEELKELAGSFPLIELLEKKGYDKFSKYIVTEPEYIECLETLYVDENLELIKSWIILDLLKAASRYSDEESFGYLNDWNNAINGSSGMKSLEELGYTFVCSFAPELTGDIYAKYFFSEEEKKDVENMIYQVIDALRTRLENNSWMTEETKNTAIEKLEAISVYVGYPEEYYYDYSVINVDTGKSLLENVSNINIAFLNQHFDKADTDVDRAAWGITMPAYTVNACYIPSYNCICIPAAILSEPFYSKDASYSENLGAIGTVIGHELTHAFDTTGSQYDKDGNMANWWTDEDLEKFTEMTAGVAERYASYATVDEERVNGDLTIGETVADLGGMAVTLDILADMAEQGLEVDYQEYFTSYAKIWFRLITRESALYRLKYDPHAPTCLRTNVNVSQFQEFYDAFGVEEGDAMYTAPEDRLSVW